MLFLSFDILLNFLPTDLFILLMLLYIEIPDLVEFNDGFVLEVLRGLLMRKLSSFDLLEFRDRGFLLDVFGGLLLSFPLLPVLLLLTVLLLLLSNIS